MDTLPVTEARMQAEIEALRAQYGLDQPIFVQYFAWIGQIGMQLLLPQHGGRSSRTTELRPCGVARTW